MAIPFNREELKRFQKIDENYSIDWASNIGTGSYGVVFRGYSKQKDSLIAIKIVKSSKFSMRQIQTLKSLSSLSHPNIMGFYGDIARDENTFLFLQFCNGGTLDEYIKKGIPELQVLKLFREMVEGMCYMNAKQKMHRDFKPQNILIGPENDIKICDFGLAQGTNSIFATGAMGTPFYAAPQVFLCKKDKQNKGNYEYNCDVWSCGLILYEMLTQSKLFKEVSVIDFIIKDYQQLKQEWLCYQRGMKEPKDKKHLHPLWEYFLNAMIQFDFQKRPTFHQILQNLKRVYFKMEDNIKGQTNMIKDLSLKKAEAYINFQISKHQILLNLCQKFTKEDIRIHNQFKYVCMFMCILRYTLFAKEFIRNLRYRRLKYENEDLLKMSQKIANTQQKLFISEKKEKTIYTPQQIQALVQMFCDKNRFVLEHRLVFYGKQLKQTVVFTLKDKYQKRSQSSQIMKELSEVMKLVEKYSRSQVIQNNQQLCDIFQNILHHIRKRYKNYKKTFNLDELRLYAYLLISMLLQKKFPQSQYLSMNVEQQVKKIYQRSKEDLEKYIESMHDQILN